jgi:O-antigen/teichoic acid export membrane protein
LSEFDEDQLLQVAPNEPFGQVEDVLPVPQVSDTQSLDRVFVRGVAWTAAIKWATQLATWGVTVVVARLLSPADYGLVGMAAIFINLFTLLSEFGIGSSIVTLQDLDKGQIAQLNGLSIIVGFLGFLISAAAAMPLGVFFHAPKLPAIILLLSCGFIVSGIRTVPYSLLQKELRFKLLAAIEGAQGVVQAATTLILAFLGYGYWALVIGILSVSITPTILTLLWRRERFALPQFASIQKAIRYSRHILIGRLCWAGYNDSDFVIAGRVLGATPLGAYTLAWTLAHTPLDKLSTLVNRVTPSVFAKIQSDRSALRRYLRNITGGMDLLVFPATVGIILVAPEFVPVVFGAKWHDAVIPLQLLAISALMRSNLILLIPILNVVGEERLVMRNSVVLLCLLPLTFFIGSYWGIVGIAAGWALVYPLLQLRLLSRTLRHLQMPVHEYLKALWPAISGCFAMAIAVEILRIQSPAEWSARIRLSLEALLGVVAYGLVMFVVHRDYVQAFIRFIKSSGESAKLT